MGGSSTSTRRLYQYNVASDTITNPGFIIAGNNANGTSGVSPTTLTGRQWGIGPRLGAAWQPADVQRTRWWCARASGMYYDRGELFSYFSPGYAIGTVTGGPFGVNQQLPFVNAAELPDGDAVLYNYLHSDVRRQWRRCPSDDGCRPIATARRATWRIRMASVAQAGADESRSPRT